MVPDGRAVIGTTHGIVLMVLEGGPLAARDIATQTGLCHPTVKEVLRRLRREGVVTMSSAHRPVYQLA
jgi:DNA-binding GntR family transcriptional regulator